MDIIGRKVVNLAKLACKRAVLIAVALLLVGVVVRLGLVQGGARLFLLHLLVWFGCRKFLIVEHIDIVNLEECLQISVLFGCLGYYIDNVLIVRCV